MLLTLFKNVALPFTLMCAAMGAEASQMTYTPVNPDFGGSPFNASGLMAEANANNHYAAPATNPSATQNFANTVTSALLAELSTKIADTIFNSTSGQSGSFVTGTAQISYSNINNSISLTVTDLTTGQTTSFSGIPGGGT